MTPELIEALGRIVGARWVRSRRAELATFTMDGLPTRESYPGVVVLPADGAQVREVVRLHPLPTSVLTIHRTSTGY